MFSLHLIRLAKVSICLITGNVNFDRLVKVVSTVLLHYTNFQFIHLFLCITMNHGYLFYSVGCNPLTSLFILIFSCPRIGQWKSFKLPSMFFWHASSLFETFIIPGTWCSRFMLSFSGLPLEWDFSARIPSYFGGEQNLETNTWVQDVLITIGMPLLPDFPHGKN